VITICPPGQVSKVWNCEDLHSAYILSTAIAFWSHIGMVDTQKHHHFARVQATRCAMLTQVIVPCGDDVQ
jgi:hypothetical protein